MFYEIGLTFHPTNTIQHQLCLVKELKRSATFERHWNFEIKDVL